MLDKVSVLIVDDEPNIVSFLEDNLSSDDYIVSTAGSISGARSKLQSVRPDLLILDVALPDGTGFDFCRELRSIDPLLVTYNPKLPIIMLTARVDEMDRVRGLKRGADDYVTKPVFYPELIARIEAVMRRSKPNSSLDVLQVSGLNIDLLGRQVRLNGKTVPFSQKEFLLLSTLASEPYKVFDKMKLLELVWGYRSSAATRTLDSHASRVRKKLREYGATRDYVLNQWGVGYRLMAPPENHEL